MRLDIFYLLKRDIVVFHLSTPSDFTMAGRKKYTIGQKASMVATLHRRQRDNNDPLRAVANDLGVDASQLRRWQAQSEAFNNFLANRPQRHVHVLAASPHPRRKSCLHLIGDRLGRCCIKTLRGDCSDWSSTDFALGFIPMSHDG